MYDSNPPPKKKKKWKKYKRKRQFYAGPKCVPLTRKLYKKDQVVVIDPQILRWRRGWTTSSRVIGKDLMPKRDTHKMRLSRVVHNSVNVRKRLLAKKVF